MAKTQSNTRNLEAFRIFPYIAWALIIGFALGVYSMTVRLKVVADELETQTSFTESQAKIAPTDIKNFEPPAKK